MTGKFKFLYNNVYNTTSNSCNCSCKKIISSCCVLVTKNENGGISRINVNGRKIVNNINSEESSGANVTVMGRNLRNNEYLFLKTNSNDGPLVWIYYKTSGNLYLSTTQRIKIFKCLKLKFTHLTDGKGTLVRNQKVIKKNVSFVLT